MISLLAGDPDALIENVCSANNLESDIGNLIRLNVKGRSSAQEQSDRELPSEEHVAEDFRKEDIWKVSLKTIQEVFAVI